MSETIKARIRQLYQFLKEANQLWYKPVRDLASQEKVLRFAEMPTHPTLQLFRPVQTSQNYQDIPAILLRVRRPQQTPCPKPSDTLLQWLLPGWDDPIKSPNVAQSLNIVVEKMFNEDPQRVDDFEAFKNTRKSDINLVTEPPVSIAIWLKEGWDDPDRQPEVFDRLKVTKTVKFTDDSQRIANFETWLQLRQDWVEPELAARRALGFYERIYEVYTTLEKDGENLELMIADGRLQWLAVSEVNGQVRIDHPILLKRVELRFTPEVPEFVLIETDLKTEIYSSLFLDLHDIPIAIRNRNKELEQAGYHPLGWDDTRGFLRAFIQTLSPTKGEFFEEPQVTEISSTPRICRDPMLVLRRRSTRIANTVNAIIEDIEAQKVFPGALEQITGISSNSNTESFVDSSNENTEDVSVKALATPSISEDEILLAKEANEEQMQIIRKLNRSGSVIVQGPPGTGKTHTIGNLIGHLLAQGKSILVTAQTAKALRVVRDKVPDMLSPLAVSVLGSDQNAREQLEAAVSSIAERMASHSAESLLHEAEKFEVERRSLLQQKKELGQKLRRSLENEYREIRVGSQSFNPSEAARYLRENQQTQSWIPPPVRIGANLTLSAEEITHLYSLADYFTAEEELDASRPIPELSSMPNERQFRIMVNEYESLVTADLTAGMDKWIRKGGNSESLSKTLAELEREFSEDFRKQSWRPHAIVAGIQGGSARAAWEKLIEYIQEASEARAQYVLVLHHQPRVTQSIALTIQKKVVAEICDYIAEGGKLGFLQLITRSEWKQFIKESSVSAGKPTHKDHFEALRALINLKHARQPLRPLWDRLVGIHTNTPFSSLGTNPEQACRALIPDILRSLDWYDKVWKQIEQNLQDEGLLSDELIASIPREASQFNEYLVIEKLATSLLPPLLTAEIGRRKLKECEAGFEEIEHLTLCIDSSAANSGCIALILTALKTRDPQAYKQALTYAKRLHTIKPLVEERNALLQRLSLVAPVWANQIASRIEPHNTKIVPGDTNSAWVWRQLNEELLERDTLNTNDIQLEIDKVDATLREITLWLIDAKAWGKQLERLKYNNSIRQALVGWLDTMKVLISTR